jgi:hypothetical protein
MFFFLFAFILVVVLAFFFKKKKKANQAEIYIPPPAIEETSKLAFELAFLYFGENWVKFKAIIPYIKQPPHFYNTIASAFDSCTSEELASLLSDLFISSISFSEQRNKITINIANDLTEKISQLN